jgi:hypothetical protein
MVVREGERSPLSSHLITIMVLQEPLLITITIITTIAITTTINCESGGRVKGEYIIAHNNNITVMLQWC